MGCDFVRVGMEDMVYKYPHRDGNIVSCEDEVKRAVQICEALGRPVATPAQARRIIGIKYQPKQEPVSHQAHSAITARFDK